MTLSDPIVGSLFITWWGGMILVVLQQKLPDPPSPEGYVVYLRSPSLAVSFPRCPSPIMLCQE